MDGSARAFCWIGMVAGFLLSSANASLIVQWDFDDGDLVPSGGSQAGTAALTTSGGAVSFPNRGDGRALQIQISTNPQSYTLILDGTGLSDFEVKYEGISDPFFIIPTSYDQIWSWSLDGVAYSSAGITTQPAPLTSTGGYGNYTVSFADVSAIEDAPTVYLRNEIQPVLGGTTSLRFDNVTVTAVPEPSAVVPLVFLGVVILVRRR